MPFHRNHHMKTKMPCEICMRTCAVFRIFLIPYDFSRETSHENHDSIRNLYAHVRGLCLFTWNITRRPRCHAKSVCARARFLECFLYLTTFHVKHHMKTTIPYEICMRTCAVCRMFLIPYDFSRETSHEDQDAMRNLYVWRLNAFPRETSHEDQDAMRNLYAHVRGAENVPWYLNAFPHDTSHED